MHTPFIREKLIGNELHLYLINYDFLVEMGCEIGNEEERQNCLERTVLDHVHTMHSEQRISKVKVFLGSILVATLTVATAPIDEARGKTVQAATTTIGLIVNGQALTTSQPFTKNGQVMAPTTVLVRALGGKSSYDAASKRLTITSGTKRIVVQIGSTTAQVNGQSTTLAVAPVLVGDTSFVPVRAVVEAFGGRVAWDAGRNTVLVSNQEIAVYEVKSGDTMWEIARKFGTTPASIQILNALGNQTTVYPGRHMIVPRNATAYVAQDDDTFWSVSRRFNTTVEAIQSLSGLTSDELRGGMVLLIPEATPTTPEPLPLPAGARSYVVLEGDTLWKVATKFNTTVAAIKDVNKMTSEVLRVGQTLIIPKATPAPTPTPAGGAGEYIVQAGDTFWGLAQRYNTTVEAIRKASSLSATDSLRVGQRIYVPGYTPAPPPPAESYLKYADPKVAAQLAKDTFTFPFRDLRSYDPFRDTWGDSRGYNPGSTATRAHEGVDIFAKKGTPLVAVGNGTIIRYGWNELGGWRVTISLDNSDYAVYYAHMSAYAPGLAKGARVKKGQLIGYVGSTGYGPAGTSGKFVNHLHFGMYDESNGFRAVNPYHILKYWEARR